MLIRAPEAHSRSIVKAISWRILGSIDTFVVSYFVTGKLGAAAGIASVESFTKIALYYVHERSWGMVKWGRGAPAEDAAAAVPAPAAPAAVPAKA